MNRTIISLYILIASLYFIGCVETETVIKLKPDGSGTLHETFLMSKMIKKQMKSMFESMAEGLGSDTAPDPGSGFDIYKENELRDKAKQMGAGVTFVSGEPYETDKAEGFKVVYAFDDINNLIINQNPGESMPSADDKGKKEVIKEHVTFKFSKGKISTLAIKSPKSSGQPLKEPKQKNDSIRNIGKDIPEENLDQVKQMFDGMRVAMAIEIDGELIKTNATHVEGNRIVVMDMDFGKLLQAPESFKKFARINPKTVEDAKKLVKNVPGIKVDLNEKIEIKFK